MMAAMKLHFIASSTETAVTAAETLASQRQGDYEQIQADSAASLVSAGELVDKTTLSRLALGRELERYDRSIDVHVSRVRHKLAHASAAAPRIDVVRGAGYVLVVAP